MVKGQVFQLTARPAWTAVHIAIWDDNTWIAGDGSDNNWLNCGSGTWYVLEALGPLAVVLNNAAGGQVASLFHLDPKTAAPGSTGLVTVGESEGDWMYCWAAGSPEEFQKLLEQERKREP